MRHRFCGFFAPLVWPLFLSVLPVSAQFMAADKIYERCADAVVLVKTPYGYGSGFFINSEGYIITNYHVIRSPNGSAVSPSVITIVTRDRRQFEVDWIDILPDFPRLDIAILKIPAWQPTPHLPLKPDPARVGEEVVAIGHPHGDTWNQSKGIISKINLPDKPYLLQHDVATDEGSSGGPLINAKGQVVGVVTGYKWMLANLGLPKVQETGKIATKITAVIEALEYRGIPYDTQPMILEGLSEYERQLRQLQKDREALERDREQLRRDREQLERDREQLRKEWEQLEQERQAFLEEKFAFEQRRQESIALLENAEQLRQELDAQRRYLRKQLIQLTERETKLQQWEERLTQKEAKLRLLTPYRLALEVGMQGAGLYSEFSQRFYGALSATAALFLRFGFERNPIGSVIRSDRLGLSYTATIIYDPRLQRFNSTVYHTLSIAIEFSEIVRIGIGRRFSADQTLYFGYPTDNLLFCLLHLSRYPSPLSLYLALYTDDTLEFRNYLIGLQFAVNLLFLRL